jgi:hypothetical protein
VLRAVSKLPAFELLKIDGNAIIGEAVGMLEEVLASRGKKLGGGRCMPTACCSYYIYIYILK